MLSPHVPEESPSAFFQEAILLFLSLSDISSSEDFSSGESEEEEGGDSAEDWGRVGPVRKNQKTSAG